MILQEKLIQMKLISKNLEHNSGTKNHYDYIAFHLIIHQKEFVVIEIKTRCFS